MTISDIKGNLLKYPIIDWGFKWFMLGLILGIQAVEIPRERLVSLNYYTLNLYVSLNKDN